MFKTLGGFRCKQDNAKTTGHTNKTSKALKIQLRMQEIELGQ